MAAQAALFERLLRAVKSVAGPALTSGGLTGTLALISGANPLQALAYGGADVLASGGSIAALRKLRPKAPIQITDTATGKITTQPGSSKLELPVNIGASILTSNAVGALMGDYPSAAQLEATSPLLQQEQQLLQRSAINQLPVEQQLVSPGTQFQMAGLPDPRSFEQLLNRRNSWMQYLSPEDQQLIASATGRG